MVWPPLPARVSGTHHGPVGRLGYVEVFVLRNICRDGESVTRSRLEKRVRGSSTNLDAGRKMPRQYMGYRAAASCHPRRLAFQRLLKPSTFQRNLAKAVMDPYIAGEVFVPESGATFGSIATSQLGAWLHLCRSCSFFPLFFSSFRDEGECINKTR